MTAVTVLHVPSASSRPAPLERDSEFLTFRLGAVAYGMDICKVREIRGYETPTLIAGAPAHVRGVLNLRGEIVPVMDLRTCLGLTRVNFDHLTVTVILQLADRVLGVVVDSVSDVVALTPAQVKPVPALGAGADMQFITGIGATGGSGRDDMLVLLDIEKMMGHPDIGQGLDAGTLQ